MNLGVSPSTVHLRNISVGLPPFATHTNRVISKNDIFVHTFIIELQI